MPKHIALVVLIVSLIVACSMVEQSVILSPINTSSSTANEFQLTSTRLITDATSRPMLPTLDEIAVWTSIAETAQYWETQGITPTETIPTSTDTPSRRSSETPDSFALTVTQLIFEATSGTYAVPITATAEYWATEGITPTFHPAYLTQEAPFATQTQAIETAIANGCEFLSIEFRQQRINLRFLSEPTEIEQLDFTFQRKIIQCPNPDLAPYRIVDFYIDVFVPLDASQDEILNYISQAILTVPDYPFEETTFGTDNVTLLVRPGDYANTYWYLMEFTYSKMLSALEDGLEGNALLEALGGIQASD